ncbi:hypothetical protein D3C78_1609860 [compost metagenome]
MTTRLRVAVDVLDQVLEGLHAGTDFFVHAQCGIEAVAGNPLRALEAAGSALGLATVTCTAAPADTVGLQNGGLDTVFLGKEDRGGEPGEAGADDRHIDVDVVCDRAVIGWRIAGGRDPVGRGVVTSLARGAGKQRIVCWVIR